MESIEKEDIRKYCVYLITCLVNGKVYVGQTCKGILSRWKQHVYCALKRKHLLFFSFAIRKYKPDSFVICTLREGLSKQEADWEEKEYIRILKSTDPEFGYNTSLGGVGGSGRSREDVKDEEIMSLYDQGLSLNKIQKQLGLSSCAVRERLVKWGIPIRPHRKPLSNELIAKEYYGGLSDVQLAKKYGVTPSTICNRRREYGVIPRPPGDRENSCILNEDILKLYEDGISNKQIAKRLGMSPAGVTKRLKKIGVENRPYGKFDIKTDYLKQLYESGMGCKEIGEIVGMSFGGVSSRLRKSGTKMRRKGPNNF